MRDVIQALQLCAVTQVQVSTLYVITDSRPSTHLRSLCGFDVGKYVCRRKDLQQFSAASAQWGVTVDGIVLVSISWPFVVVQGHSMAALIQRQVWAELFCDKSVNCKASVVQL